MKKEYNIKDKVWIHLGEPRLVEGRVVEIIDLEHLGEGHSPDRELYVIEIKTGIDDIYEVRSFEQISPDAKGPIGVYRNLKQATANNRLLKKVGMPIPLPVTGLEDAIKEIEGELFEDPDEPTPDQIHAAIERSAEQAKDKFFNPNLKKKSAPRKRQFTKRKKNDSVKSSSE